jgi:hypothetical protein
VTSLLEKNFSTIVFLERNWDSTLVYSMKQLSFNPKDAELKDYCHYFRGYSFKEKNF